MLIHPYMLITRLSTSQDTHMIIPITRLPYMTRQYPHHQIPILEAVVVELGPEHRPDKFLLSKPLLSIPEAFLKLHLIWQPTGRCCCLESLMLQTLVGREPSSGHLQTWSVPVHIGFHYRVNRYTWPLKLSDISVHTYRSALTKWLVPTK